MYIVSQVPYRRGIYQICKCKLMYCFELLCLNILCPILPVDCPIWISPSVFSNVYSQGAYNLMGYVYQLIVIQSVQITWKQLNTVRPMAVLLYIASYFYDHSYKVVRVWIPLMARCTRYNIMWSSPSVTSSQFSGILQVLRFPPPIKLTAMT